MPALNASDSILDLDLVQPPLTFVNPAEILANAINDVYLETIRQFSDNISRIIEAQNQLMVKALAAQFTFEKLFPKNMFDFIQTIPVEGEIVDVEADPLLLPAPTKSRLGIHMTSIKTFKFKRKLLKGVSQKNAPGRLMALLMESKDLFASDEEIRKLLKLEENRSIGWVLRDLKKKFRTNFLVLTFERTENPLGYQISDIQYLQ